jgi:hypothetical protein
VKEESTVGGLGNDEGIDIGDGEGEDDSDGGVTQQNTMPSARKPPARKSSRRKRSSNNPGSAAAAVPLGEGGEVEVAKKVAGGKKQSKKRKTNTTNAEHIVLKRSLEDEGLMGDKPRDSFESEEKLSPSKRLVGSEEQANKNLNAQSAFQKGKSNHHGYQAQKVKVRYDNKASKYHGKLLGTFPFITGVGGDAKNVDKNSAAAHFTPSGNTSLAQYGVTVPAVTQNGGVVARGRFRFEAPGHEDKEYDGQGITNHALYKRAMEEAAELARESQGQGDNIFLAFRAEDGEPLDEPPIAMYDCVSGDGACLRASVQDGGVGVNKAGKRAALEKEKMYKATSDNITYEGTPWSNILFIRQFDRKQLAKWLKDNGYGSIEDVEKKIGDSRLFKQYMVKSKLYRIGNQYTRLIKMTDFNEKNFRKI